MKPMKTQLWFGLLAIGMGLAGRGVSAGDTPVVNLMTHDSFAVQQSTLDRFEAQHGAVVRILKSGDAGAALNQAILSRKNPLADVFYGVDNTFMSRALAADIFEPYPSPMADRLPPELRLDPQNRLLPVSYGDVCLNIDRQWFQSRQMTPPGDLADLLLPAYKGLCVVTNPATSSPGLAFLLTTVGRFGEDGFVDFWRRLRANDVYVSNGWTDAYYGQFSRAKGGTRPIVLSYATSPAAEVHFSQTPLTEAPTAALLEAGSAFRQIEFAGVIKGARRPDLARKLLDFMLGPEFQADIPLYMWVFPALPDTPLPEVFHNFARQARTPVTLSHDAIEKGREGWVEAWTQAVLR